MLQMDAGNHPLRQQANDRQIDAADEREPRQNAVDIFRRVAPGANAGNEAAVLAHVVGQLRGIENDPHVKEGEKDDQRDVDDRVERLAPADHLAEALNVRRAVAEKSARRSAAR